MGVDPIQLSSENKKKKYIMSVQPLILLLIRGMQEKYLKIRLFGIKPVFYQQKHYLVPL